MSRKYYQKITEYLARHYEVTPYERHDETHPVVWYPAPANRRTHPDSIFGTTPTRSIPQTDYTFYDYGYLHSLQNSKRNLFNGTTFNVMRFNPQTLRIDAEFGTYYDVIATCYALENEIFNAESARLFRLPLRHQYHREISERQSLTSGKGRAAALGGGTLIIFNDKGTYRALVNQRGANQAARPNSFHVIPAYIVQPMGTTMHPQEWGVTHHVYREYLEELFGMAESDTIDYHHPALDDFRAMEATGDAAIYLLGASVSLLTLRVEVSTLMLIHDAGWWERVNAPDSAFPLQLTETHELYFLALDDDSAALTMLGDEYFLNMPPQALATLWAGIDLGRELIV